VFVVDKNIMNLYIPTPDEVLLEKSSNISKEVEVALLRYVMYQIKSYCGEPIYFYADDMRSKIPDHLFKPMQLYLKAHGWDLKVDRYELPLNRGWPVYRLDKYRPVRNRFVKAWRAFWE